MTPPWFRNNNPVSVSHSAGNEAARVPPLAVFPDGGRATSNTTEKCGHVGSFLGTRNPCGFLLRFTVWLPRFQVQKPDYFLTCSWDMPLSEMFDSIEWHAEARSLSDRATYFIDALCRVQSDKVNLNRLGSLDILESEAQQALAQSSGYVLVFSRKTAERWKDSRPSLWMLFEAFRAQELNLGWDLASTTGTLATMRPFDNGCWAFGAFDAETAESLSTLAIQAESCICSHGADRQMILHQLLVSISC